MLTSAACGSQPAGSEAAGHGRAWGIKQREAGMDAGSIPAKTLIEGNRSRPLASNRTPGVTSRYGCGDGIEPLGQGADRGPARGLPQ